MLRKYLWIFTCIVFLWGCSPRTLDEETQTPLTATQDSLEIKNTATISPTNTLTNLATDKVVTPTYESSISLPELSTNDIAGIETVKTTDVQRIAEAGMTWTRRNALEWYTVEAVKGERNWDAVEPLESELIEASNLGIKTILIVHGAPDWAQKVAGMYCGPVREEELKTMGDFLYDTVLRYSQPPYNVKYWELGNEPDVNVVTSKPKMQYGCWGDSADDFFGGGYYAEMLKVVYPRIKSADPEAQVLIGGLLMDCDPVNPPEEPAGSGMYKDCKATTFFEGILHNGGGDYFDGVAFHAYDYYYGTVGQFGNNNWNSSWDSTGPVLAAKEKYINSLLESFGYRDKFLMNTEGALICGRTGKEPACNSDDFNITKASYLVQAYTSSRSLGLKANIWYNLHGWRGSGITTREGNSLPAFQALIFNTSILESTKYQEKINDYDGLVGYSFERSDAIIWVIWSLDGSLKSINPDVLPDKLYDYLGEEITGNTEISIGSTPVYLIWEKST